MTPWPSDFEAGDFQVAMTKAFNDSYARTAGVSEIASTLAVVFHETDIKMKRIQGAIEGMLFLYD